MKLDTLGRKPQVLELVRNHIYVAEYAKVSQLVPFSVKLQVLTLSLKPYWNKSHLISVPPPPQKMAISGGGYDFLDFKMM